MTKDCWIHRRAEANVSFLVILRDDGETEFRRRWPGTVRTDVLMAVLSGITGGTDGTHELVEGASP